MAAFDWVNRLFQGGDQTRGLSGTLHGAVALDDANSFYNYRLRRHYTDADIGLEPSRLWYTNDDLEARTGLGRHVTDALTEGQRFTDVLVVLSGEDYDHALTRDAGFLQRVSETLATAYEDFVRQTALPPLNRRLGVWIVREGAEEIGGEDFGLVDGEFITGILPNLYRQPGASSRAILAIQVNLPGVWEGYREVGRLYDDQVLFSMGNHWLDSFQHPSLREAALYRLQLDDDGSFFHIINPDLQDRYEVMTRDQDGVSVISISSRAGEALAHLVLWTVEQGDAPAVVLDDAASVDEVSHPGPTPDIAPPMMLDGADMIIEQLPRSRGPKTIIPEAHKERIFTLQERGALLQKVHFSAFMLGYDVYVGPRAEVGTSVREPVATFQVRKRTVSLLASGSGVVMDGVPVPVGEARIVDGDAVIEVNQQRLDYRDLRGVDAEGWPYVGEIRRPASSTYMLWGREYAIGRSRECRVVLPDEPQNANIVWKPKVGDGAMIRSKTGEIPKSRFYTDSIMVASEHGLLALAGSSPEIVCAASHCYTYVRRHHGQVHALFPTSSGKSPQRMSLEPGDEILLGNCLFHVGYTPSADAVPRELAPAPALSGGLGRPSFAGLESDTDDEPPAHFAPPAEESLDGGASKKLDSFVVEAEPASSGLGNLPIFEDDGPPISLPAAPTPSETALDAALTELDAPLPAAFGGLDLPGAAPPPLKLPTSLGGVSDIPVDDVDGDETPSDEAPSAASAAQEGHPTPGAPDEMPGLAVLHYETSEHTEHPDSDSSDKTDIVGEAPSLPGWSDGSGTLVVATEDADLPQNKPEQAASTMRTLVVAVEDADAQFELGRPARLVVEGWAVKGNVTCGNFEGADLLIPENRIEPGQAFARRTYFTMRVRGRKGHVDVVDVDEVRVNGEAASTDRYERLDDMTLSVIRRDEEGDEDFTVDLSIQHDVRLPDPRARLVGVDTEEPLTLALLAKGLPLRAERRLSLGGLAFTTWFDGTSVVLRDYLDSYQQEDGRFRSFLVQRQGEAFVTAPEDGADIVLSAGDRILVGTQVVRVATS